MRASTIAGILATLLAAAVVAPLAVPAASWPVIARDFLADRAVAETGAENLVSSVYLGYRAYDTIGETIVLLIALAAVVDLVAAKGSGTSDRRPLAETRRAPRTRRTSIIDLTAGKLAPIVLLFGIYVMLYGHLSPGGGFQGGAVLASGIVFIAIGRREGGRGRIGGGRGVLGYRGLARLEAAAFCGLLVLTLLPAAFGSGFLANPVSDGAAFPAVSYVIAFNAVIGLKVGSGLALVCLVMMGDAL